MNLFNSLFGLTRRNRPEVGIIRWRGSGARWARDRYGTSLRSAWRRTL